MKFDPNQMLSQLPLPATSRWPEGVWDIEPFEKNGVRLVFFAPRGRDHQGCHEEDEFYFVIRGSGELVVGSDRYTCKVGDAFFVEAGRDHHFENFSDDFATWAIFF